VTGPRPRLSATRARKNLKWLRENAPQVFTEPEPKQGWMSVIPVSVLLNLHRQVPASTTAPLDLKELAKVNFPRVQWTG
jgi:hypothetical protein